jgi:hypothetical protein
MSAKKKFEPKEYRWPSLDGVFYSFRDTFRVLYEAHFTGLYSHLKDIWNWDLGRPPGRGEPMYPLYEAKRYDPNDEIPMGAWHYFDPIKKKKAEIEGDQLEWIEQFLFVFLKVVGIGGEADSDLFPHFRKRDYSNLSLGSDSAPAPFSEQDWRSVIIHDQMWKCALDGRFIQIEHNRPRTYYEIFFPKDRVDRLATELAGNSTPPFRGWKKDVAVKLQEMNVTGDTLSNTEALARVLKNGGMEMTVDRDQETVWFGWRNDEHKSLKAVDNALPSIRKWLEQ